MLTHLAEPRHPELGTLAAIGLGARVGVLFAAFDALAASWLTRAVVGGLDYHPQSVVSFLLSAGVHAVVGALGAVLVAKSATRLGAMSASRLGERIGRTAREVAARAAALGVLLAIAAHQASLLPNRAIEIRQSLALAAGLAGLIVLSLATRRLGTWLAGVASPWMAAATLGLVPWLTGTALADRHWSTKQWTALCVVVLLAAAATALRTALASARATSGLVVVGFLLVALAGGRLDQGVLDDLPEDPAGAQGTHVILISLDTVRADHLSVYGYARDTTPYLREFAREAVLFTRSTSAADFTLASHASLFTGRYPIDHGARPDPDRILSPPLPREATTLAEILAGERWWTAAVAANCVLLHSQFGLAQGFHHYDARYRRMLFPRTPPWTLRARVHDTLEEHLPRREFDVPFRDAAEVNRDVLALLERRPVDRPFFLFVNYMDAHTPLRPPAPYDTLFTAEARPMDMPRFLAQKEQLYAGRQALPAADREAYVALYDGSIAYLDAHLRALFAELRAQGLYDDALIVVTADHGEAFGEHGTLEHGMSAYQEQIHVPLLIKRPRSRAGATVDSVASGVDLLPTVLAVLGLAPAEGLPGVALFGAPLPADRVVFSEHYPTRWHVSLDEQRAVHQTTASWDRFTRVRRDDGRAETYDLATDPGQERPLEALPSGAPDLEALLKAWIAPMRTGGTREDRRTIDALRSLGYAK